MPRQARRFHSGCLFLCNKIPYKRKKYSEKVTVLLFRMIVHTNGGEGEPTHIALQSALLGDPNAMHFGTRLRTIC